MRPSQARGATFTRLSLLLLVTCLGWHEARGDATTLDRQRQLIGHLHQSMRAMEIRGAPDSAAGALEAWRTFELVTAPARTGAQILIEAMARHQERHGATGAGSARPALQAVWDLDEVRQAVRSTTDQLLAVAIERTFLDLETGGVGCCTCTSPATCNDGAFCNGSETCQTICLSGTPPCIDGDNCTSDGCVEATDTCTFTPIPPPNQVASLNLRKNTPGSTVATLLWSSVSGASAYNVYRGVQRNLSDLACYAPAVSATALEDDGSTPAGVVVYLVTATACGESGLGNASAGPRPTPPGCP